MSSRQRARLLKVGKELLVDKEPVRIEDDEEEEDSESEQVVPMKSNSKRKKKDKRKLQKQIQSFAFSESEESNNDPEESSQVPEETPVGPIDDEHSLNTEQEENDDKENANDAEQEEVVEASMEEAEAEEEEEDDQFTLTQKQTFVFESDDSQEEKSAESDSDQLNLALLPQKDALPITANDDTTAENKLLDDLIEQNQQFLSTDGKNNSLNELEYFNEASLLQLKDIDTKSLDLDNVVRARFGRNFDPNNPVAGLDGPEEDRRGGRGGAGGERRNRFQRPNLQFHNNNVPGGGRFSSSRKYLFGLLKEDWVKPLSFIGGGIGMTKYTFSLSDDLDEEDDNKEETGRRVNSRNLQQKRNFKFSGRSSSSHPSEQNAVRNIFSFEYSKEYQQLTDDYEVLLQSNDPNYLIMFLVNYPYFIRGFYDLSLIYFQMGQIDKTLNLLRHCIFIYESSFLESFKVCYGGNYLPLDLHEENRLFYSIFMKYVQIITNQGYYPLALDIVRILLALNPNDSTEYGLLLMLDYYCLMNKRYDLILNLSGVKSLVKTTSWNYYQYQLEMKKEKEEEVVERLKMNNDVNDGGVESTEEQKEIKEKKPIVPKPSMKELHLKTKGFSKKFEENIFTMIDHWKYSYVIDIEEEEEEETAEETGRTEEKSVENEKEAKRYGEKNEEIVQNESVEEDEAETQFADDATSVASSEVRSESSKKPRKGSFTAFFRLFTRIILFIFCF
jgi:hypothetical protein